MTAGLVDLLSAHAGLRVERRSLALDHLMLIHPVGDYHPHRFRSGDVVLRDKLIDPRKHFRLKAHPNQLTFPGGRRAATFLR